MNHRQALQSALVTAALSSLIAFANPAQAGGGVSPGAAVGIGLGAFALGAAAASAPYYGGYAPYYAAAPYAPYGYYPPAPTYYPQAYAPRSCWNPYYGTYYAC